MDQVTLEWKLSSGSISQVYGSGLEYAFVSDDFKQIHPLVYCKDFMQDAITGAIHKKAMSIYGFSYNPQKDPPIYFKKTRLLVTNSADPHFSNKIIPLLEFMGQIEKKLKMVKSVAYKVENSAKKYSNGAFIIDGSARWQISPPMISLYTLLIRIGLVHKIGVSYQETVDGVVKGTIPAAQENDRSQLSSAIKGLGWILDHGDLKLFGRTRSKNYKDLSVNFVHNSTGIVSYSSKNAALKKEYPNWYVE